MFATTGTLLTSAQLYTLTVILSLLVLTDTVTPSTKQNKGLWTLLQTAIIKSGHIILFHLFILLNSYPRMFIDFRKGARKRNIDVEREH